MASTRGSHMTTAFTPACYPTACAQTAMANMLIRRMSSHEALEGKPKKNTAETGSFYEDSAIGRFNRKFGKSAVRGVG
jgi:hypothetical protein